MSNYTLNLQLVDFTEAFFFFFFFFLRSPFTEPEQYSVLCTDRKFWQFQISQKLTSSALFTGRKLWELSSSRKLTVFCIVYWKKIV